MTTTYTWRIANLERETADGYVFTAHYTVDAKDDTCSAGAYGSISFERPEGELITFADLTEETVIGWVKDKLGDEAVCLQAQLDEQRNPTKASGLPWAS